MNSPCIEYLAIYVYPLVFTCYQYLCYIGLRNGGDQFSCNESSKFVHLQTNIKCPIYINKNNKSPCGTYNETAYPFPTT